MFLLISLTFSEGGSKVQSMRAFVRGLFRRFFVAFRTRLDLVLEVMALRHQIAVMERSIDRPRFSTADRLFWIVLSRCWSRWPEALEIIEAETVLRWQRAGRRPRWVWPWPRRRLGRPRIDRDVRQLIRRMSLSNCLWGAPRIHGELGMLGIRVARSTVAKYMIRQPGPPSPTWRTFWRIHGRELIATQGMFGASHQLTNIKHLVLSLVFRSPWGGPPEIQKALDNRVNTSLRLGRSLHARPDSTAIRTLVAARNRGPPARALKTALAGCPLAPRARRGSWCPGNPAASVSRFSRHPRRPTPRVVHGRELAP